MHVLHGKEKNMKKAFTLAEVLITLAIIGIVAALTIPTLIQTYQEKAWDTASEVFQRRLGEALKVMNVQGTLAGYKTTEEFVNELSKHIKISKICKNDDLTACFSDKIYWGDQEIDITKVENAKNFDKEDWETNTVGVQFANGTAGLIAYNPSCTQDPFRNNVITVGKGGIGTDCLAILYDTTGFKTPNTSGKDLRAINITTIGNFCFVELNGTCYGAAFKATPVTKAECKEMNESGEYGDFPATYCTRSYADYYYYAFLGAAKQCKHIDNLITQEQVTEIANYVYNETKFEVNYGYANVNLDIKKLNSFGLSVGDTLMGMYTSKDGIYYVRGKEFFEDELKGYSGSLSNFNNDFAMCVIK